MAEETIPTRELVVRYEGVFDFDALFAAVVNWMKTYRYHYHEETYKHKIPSPRGAEQEITMIGVKHVTDFYDYEIKLKWHTWDQTEVEVTRNGQKKKLTKARIEIRINGKVKIDWQKRFKGSKFREILYKIWYKAYRRDVETVWHDNLYYRTYNLQEIIKKFFDMQAKGYEYKGYLGEER